MDKKPKPPPVDDPEESARFVETAKTLDTERNKGSFGKAIKAVVPRKLRKR